jgi:dipeptidyl aminopeptidase/acylaminoacyl peptidase
VSDRICLRCDWADEGDGAACPRCGAPLYRLPESTTRREVTAVLRPQPQPAGDGILGSPVELAQDDESVPPATPVDRRRRAVIVGVLTVVAVAVVTTVASFDRTRTQPAVTRPTVPLPPEVPELDYVIDLDTGVMTPLPEAIVRSLGGFGNRYAVSPDGSRLAYVGTEDDRPDVGHPRERVGQIFIAGIDGTGVRQVTQAPNGASSPAWSPDATSIAYEASGNRHRLGLYVVDVASGESTQIDGVNVDYERCIVGLDPQCRRGDTSPRPVGPLEPQFTPDGSSLIYSGRSDRHAVIWIVPVAGGESTLLTGPRSSLRAAKNGSLSPDGSLVTFLGLSPDGSVVDFFGRPEPQRWVADTDGTDPRLLPDVYGIPCRSNPAGTWSADGSRIVCAEASKVIVIDIATGTATPVAFGRGAVWLDDDRLLVSV